MGWKFWQLALLNHLVKLDVCLKRAGNKEVANQSEVRMRGGSAWGAIFLRGSQNSPKSFQYPQLWYTKENQSNPNRSCLGGGRGGGEI
jgi:hypothetical protein